MWKKIFEAIVPASVAALVAVVVTVAAPNTAIYLGGTAVLFILSGIIANFWNNNSELRDNVSNQVQVENKHGSPCEENASDLLNKLLELQREVDDIKKDISQTNKNVTSQNSTINRHDEQIQNLSRQ